MENPWEGEYEYENTRRAIYDGAYFVPVCSKCSRYVKAPKEMVFNHEGQPKPNQVDCKKCGKTDMLFEGYY